MPPDPPRPPRTNYRVVFWSLVVIVGLLTATLGVVVASTRDSDDDVARDDPPGDADEPETTEPPDDPPTQAELEALVAETSTFVEEQRGLTFKRPVVVELADDDEFTDRLLEDFEEEEADLAEAQALLEAFGLIEPGTSLSEVMQDALSGGVIGFYDPETDELVVRGAALTPSVRVTIAHELTHALDDQHFELDRPAYDEGQDGDGDGTPDELSFGFTALVEGSASVVDEAYLEGLSDDERDDYDDEQADMAGQMPEGVPEIVLSQLGLPYVLGPVLIAALETAGGQERLDAAYAAPPSTSEGVMHPDTYLDGQTAVAVPQPEADPGGEVVGEPSLMGELFTVLVLSEEIPSPDAFAAGRGWGGDLLVTWRDGDRPCARTNMVGDSPEETAELHAAWTAWAESAPVEVEVSALDAANPFTVTSCGTGASSSSDEEAPR